VSDITEPSCGRCRWQKKLTAPRRYVDEKTGPALGVAVYTGPWAGVHIGDQHFDALGAHYCEHPKQPRGLVLTNYHCPNFEYAPEVDAQLQIDGAAPLPLVGEK
jgi:hypothetical protein